MGLEIKELLTKSAPVHNMMVRAGRAFQTQVRQTDVSNGNLVSLFIENPSDSDYDYEWTMVLRATNLCNVEWSGGATENTQGTDATIANLNMGSSLAFNGNVRYSTTDADYDHENDTANDFIPAGRAIRLGGSKVSGISAKMTPGDNGLVDIINRSGGSASRIVAKAVIYMIDGTYLPRA